MNLVNFLFTEDEPPMVIDDDGASSESSALGAPGNLLYNHPYYSLHSLFKIILVEKLRKYP